MYRMLFTWRLCIGDQGSMVYDQHWCFGEYAPALIALNTWDGVGEPPGDWIKSSHD